MELTQKKIDELLDKLLMIAKDQRSAVPYSKVDGFAQALVFLGPNLEPAAHEARWRNESEKYALMRAVSEVAKKMLCQAVVLITDVRWVSNEKAEKMLGLPPLKEIGLEKWGELYKREVTKRYKGYLGNAPPELYNEAIMVIMKGPRLKGVPTRTAQYEKGPNDSIRWLPKIDVEGETTHFNLLPDWWC
jgi:hypothetical protein